MNDFLLSQVLVAIAIGFDLLSFQFKERQKIVACLFCAGVLISTHFALLEQWTAASLMGIATLRYLLSIFSTSSIFMYLFCLSSVVATALTFTGVTSIISCLGSTFQTIAAFQQNDRKLRQLMIVGTSFWLLHNYLIGSPTAVLMEVLFISSNLIGYYRYYYKKACSV
ncbi:YgjV family protein [Aliagarivorans marinus]|uniref:YgjV family protein n=1 Tax=Aliagarivorans marinus TaxID=561965 RepID=UPI00040110EB|nr:YgjV family protein [Aliagarivorans marinus]